MGILNEVYNKVIEISPILTLILSLLPFIKIIVESQSLHELEHILITPWKKFINNVSSIIFVSTLITIIIGFELLVDSEDNLLAKGIDSQNLYAILLLWILISIILLIIFYSLSLMIKIFFTNKAYFITIESDDWKIDKMKNSKTLLISKDNMLMEYSDWGDKPIIKKYHQQGIPLNIVKNYLINHKIIALISNALLLLVFGYLIYLSFNNKALYFNFLYFYLGIIGFSFLLLLIMDLFINKNNNQT